MSKIKYCVNTQVKNKSSDFFSLTNDFKDQIGTINDVAVHIKKGHAICASLLNGESRSKANVFGSQWLLLDIDNTEVVDGEKRYKQELTLDDALENVFIQQHCALIYTTASHTPEWHRFRLVFVLNKFYQDRDLIEAMIDLLMSQLPHDSSCKDASRIFYGNTDAIFPLFNESAVLPQDWAERASIKADQAKEYRAQLEVKAKERREKFNRLADSEKWNVDSLIDEALSHIPPRSPGSSNYQECLKVLMALHSHYGNECEPIAEIWSPSIPGNTWNIKRKIRSFRREGLTIGTLFAIAKKYGFKFPEVKKQENRNLAFEISHSELDKPDYSPTLNAELKQAKAKLDKYEQHLDGLKNERQKIEENIARIDEQLLSLNNESKASFYEKDFELNRLKQDRQIKLDALRRIKDRLKGARSDRFSQRVQLNQLKKDRAKQEKEEGPTGFEKDLEAVSKIEGLSFNTLTQYAELDGIPLELDHPRAELSRLTGFTGWQTSDNSVVNILLDKAKQKKYCPIQEYLELASNRHPEANHDFLDDLAQRLFGINSEVQNAFLKAFLIGSVRRAFEPGCEHPYMLILHSAKQGKGKSSFIRELYGADFAGEGQIGFDVDGLLAMSQSWVHEIDECDQIFTRRDASASKIKGFISVKTDTYRAPYGRASKKHQRRTVLIGTTNHREFLTDETGNRRFAILDIADDWSIDLDWIKENRDYIWACAVHGVRAGVPNRIPERLFSAAEEETANFLESDPWEEEIAKYISKFNEVTVKEIMDDVLKIEMSRKTMSEQRRIGRILSTLGWRKHRRTVDGVRAKVWVKNLPDPLPLSGPYSFESTGADSKLYVEGDSGSLPPYTPFFKEKDIYRKQGIEGKDQRSPLLYPPYIETQLRGETGAGGQTHIQQGFEAGSPKNNTGTDEGIHQKLDPDSPRSIDSGGNSDASDDYFGEEF